MDRQHQSHPNNTPSVADLLSRACNGDESALYAMADIASRAEKVEDKVKQADYRAEQAMARAEKAEDRAEKAESELRILKYVWLMRNRCSHQHLTSHQAIPRF